MTTDIQHLITERLASIGVETHIDVTRYPSIVALFEDAFETHADALRANTVMRQLNDELAARAQALLAPRADAPLTGRRRTPRRRRGNTRFPLGR